MLKTVKIWFIICVKTKGAIMKEFEAEQAHEFCKISVACVEVSTHVVLGGGAAL